MSYDSLSDEELVELAKTDKGKPFEEISERYNKLIRGIINKFFCLDVDREDLMQVGLIALVSAVDNYNGSTNFSTFAYTCIQNRVYSALKNINAKKNCPLKNYIPLSGYGDGDTDKTEILVDAEIGPEDFFIDNERKIEIESIIKNTLSKLEHRVLELHLEGFSYKQIGNKINKTENSVDNALQRVRKKLRGILNAC